MKLATCKAFFKEFFDAESKPAELLSDEDEDFRKVGKIVFTDYNDKNLTKEIDFYLNCGVDVGGPTLTLFTDGCMGIILPHEYFRKSSTKRIMAVIAHEVGHYCCEHIIHQGYGRQLDVDTERLEKLSKIASDKNSTDRDFKNYARGLFFSLLRGGVTVREKEADLVASFYVPVDDLIAVHSEDLIPKYSLAARLEKANRLKFLNVLAEIETEQAEKKLSIKIHINPPKAKKVEINV